MGFELINRITVKKDGVYLSTHSSNDSSPYYSHRIGFLSDAYAEGGQKELDKKIFELLYTNAQLRGKHESILRYQEVWDGSEGLEIHTLAAVINIKLLPVFAVQFQISFCFFEIQTGNAGGHVPSVGRIVSASRGKENRQDAEKKIIKQERGCGYSLFFKGR